MRIFLVEFVKKLEPRKFLHTSEEMVQDQYEEVFEVIFVMKGAVAIGYRLFDEIFYGKKFIVKNDKKRANKKRLGVVNDYSCLENKCSEFLYLPIDNVEGLAMRKNNFQQLMLDPQAKKMKAAISENYKINIQDPLHEHRYEMATKFKNRIDYVDIKAYGLGQV